MSLMTRSELKKLEKQDLVVDENARRLARYPEAIRLLRSIAGMAVHWEPLTPGDIREVKTFLAAEPEGDKG